MAASTSILNFAYSSDALFRSFWSPLSSALAAAGWSKVWSNIDWSTVTKPTTTQTVAGAEVWAMQDSLQASSSKFVKLEYGTAGSATSPSLWLTVGNTHDGVGTLGGNLMSRSQLSITGSGSNYSCRFSGANNRFCCMYAQDNASSNQFGFSIERSHDSSGSDTGDGCLVLYYVINAAYSQFVPTSGPNATYYSHWNATVPPTGTGAYNNDVFVYPVRGWALGESSASLNFFVYFNVDLTASNAISATLWDGFSHTILPGGNGLSTNGSLAYGGAPVLAMRYD